MSGLPLIGVTACSKQVGLHAYHISGDKYVRAVAIAAKGLPLIIPSLADLFEPAIILDGQDAVRVPRSFSCTRPFHDAGPAFFAVAAHYPAREASLLL